MLLHLLQSLLALFEQLPAFGVRLLAVVFGVVGVGEELLDLVEVGLDGVVLLLRLVEGLLRLFRELLALLGGLADALLDLVDELLDRALLAALVLRQERLDLLDDLLDDFFHVPGDVVDGLFGLRVAILGGSLRLVEELLRLLSVLLRTACVVGLDFFQALLHLLEALLALRVRQRARVLGGLGLLNHLFYFIKVLFVLVVLRLVLLDLALDLGGELLRLLSEIAELLLDGLERLAERRVAVAHQALQLLDQLLQGALHLLGQLLVSLLRLGVAGLGVRLGRLELRLRLLAVLFRLVPVALLDQVQRLLAPGDGILAFAPGLLAEGDRFPGGLVKLLQLLELLLVLVELGLDLVVDLLALLVGLLRLGREGADLRLHRLDEFRQRRLALRQHLLEVVDDGLQRLLHAVGKVLVDLLQLVDAELRFALRRLEVLLRRIDFLAGLLPLLLLEEVDALLDSSEDGLAGVEGFLAVLLEKDAGLDPLAAVLVDGVFDLLLHLLEPGLDVVDGALDLVDQTPGLIDVRLQRVTDVLLDGVGGVLDCLLRLLDGVLRRGDGALRHVEHVLRARGDGAHDRPARGVAGGLDRVDHLAELGRESVDHRSGHGDRLRGAHLDGALALQNRRLRQRQARLADVDGDVGSRHQAGLESLHQARELVAGRVHGVERRGLDRVERVACVLDGLLGDVGDLRGRLVRLRQGLPGHVGRRVGRFLRRLGDLAGRLRDVILEAREPSLDGLERRLRDVACALLHLIERLLDVLPDLLRCVHRLGGALGRLARGLEGKRRGVLDLVGDLLRLLGGLL